MDAEKLNQALYEKMAAEQEQYRLVLLGQTPEEVLNHAAEYAIREDILMEMEELDLSPKEAAALLESSTPLADVYEDFRNRDGHMDRVRECIEDLARGLLESKRETTRSIPLYQQSGIYARDHGELEIFRASHQANVSCRDAIQSAIRDGYDGMHLSHDAVKDVLAEFGPERVSYVLATSIHGTTRDPRFSRDNLIWGTTVPMVETEALRTDYTLYSHPVLIDAFISIVRSELEVMREQRSTAEKRPSIKAQLTAKPVPSDKPDKPKDKEAR